MKALAASLVGLVFATGLPADPPAPQPKTERALRRPRTGEATPKTEQPNSELIAALRDPDLPTRRQAATQLGSRGAVAAEAVPALVTALKDDKEPAMRASAAEALGGIGLAAKAAVPPLLAALKDGDPLV